MLPPFSEATQDRLVTDMNPNGDLTINGLELFDFFAQVQLFSPKIDTLSRIRTAVNNTTSQGWANHRMSAWKHLVG